MKITKLTSIITAVLITFALLLTSCAGAGAGGGNAPEGTITLNFGGASASQNARAAAPSTAPDDATLAQLTYTVQLKGAATITAGPTKKGEQRLSISAPAGQYTLTVTATLNGVKYAEGSTSVKIEAGKTTPARVQMKLTDGSGIIIDYYDFIGDSISAFTTWINNVSFNTISNPYNVKLNVSALGGMPGINLESVGHVIFTKYDLSGGPSVYINLNLEDSPMTVLEKGAFKTCQSITAITLPKNLVTIGEAALSSCANLSNITIPNSVTTIGKQAFQSCESFTKITIPAGVTKIDDYAFHYCTNLTSVTFATGSNIVDANFGVSAFPQGADGFGGDSLKTAYTAPVPPATGGAGTYIRPQDGTTWSKQ